MTRRIVVLSGPIGAGKSTLAKALEVQYGATVISTRTFLEARARARDLDLNRERGALQVFGELLDQETAGLWVADDVARQVMELADDALLVVDGIRLLSQVEGVRQAVGFRVDHVHVTASRSVLSNRYASRGTASGLKEMATYEAAASNATEAGIDALADDADISIDTNRSSRGDVLTRCAARLGLLNMGGYVDLLVGGQYGSEGKGNVAYYLAPEYDILMRVGGPNAGHKVPFGDGSFTHRLLPSGSLANENARIVLGPGSVLALDVLLKEIADCLPDGRERLCIDPNAVIIDEWDRAQEMRLTSTIGSTGSGTGLATARRIALRGVVDPVEGVVPPVRTAQDVPELSGYLQPTTDVMMASLARGERVLLEGTQGTSLSIYHGDYPYVTSRDTTASGCLAEAGIGPKRVRRVIAVCRTYPIRVGNPQGGTGTSGPMNQEISWEQVAERSGRPLTDFDGEVGSVTNRRRRVSEFDWQQLQRSVFLNSATDVALTFADHLDGQNVNARRFDQLTQQTQRFVNEIEDVSSIQVSLIATRFDRRSIIDRRQWSST